jgi:hypothetical protein
VRSAHSTQHLDSLVAVSALLSGSEFITKTVAFVGDRLTIIFSTSANDTNVGCRAGFICLKYPSCVTHTVNGSIFDRRAAALCPTITQQIRNPSMMFGGFFVARRRSPTISCQHLHEGIPVETLRFRRCESRRLQFDLWNLQLVYAMSAARMLDEPEFCCPHVVTEAQGLNDATNFGVAALPVYRHCRGSTARQ